MHLLRPRPHERRPDSRVRVPSARSPRQIDGIEIVAITAFDGGSTADHAYARATVVTHTSSFSTHTLIYLDDRGERNSFVLKHGR
ncbi:hypothetical protein [Nocardia wallacei]|uniref:hypothetical protein n=1 Tax=Nocardia wallacei TaxID=480035 RepID=UPI002457A780|nr:hypothetical protein [Nocardia wallacei]